LSVNQISFCFARHFVAEASDFLLLAKRLVIKGFRSPLRGFSDPLSLYEQRKWAKKIAPLSPNTVSLMKLLGRSGYRTSLSCILTGGVHAATLRAQPALFQRSPVATAWGFLVSNLEALMSLIYSIKTL